jgi:hypothetical protein
MLSLLPLRLSWAPLCLAACLLSAHTQAQSPYFQVALSTPVAGSASTHFVTTRLQSTEEVHLYREHPLMDPCDYLLPLPDSLAPLLVELVELTVARPAYDSPGVVLHWTTTEEQHNAGFAIERRDEGQTEFQRVGTVPGQGSSHDTHRYAYVDEPNTNPQTSYYRLRQLDSEGGAGTISPPREVGGLPAGLPLPEPGAQPEPVLLPEPQPIEAAPVAIKE